MTMQVRVSVTELTVVPTLLGEPILCIAMGDQRETHAEQVASFDVRNAAIDLVDLEVWDSDATHMVRLHVIMT